MTATSAAPMPANPNVEGLRRVSAEMIERINGGFVPSGQKVNTSSQIIAWAARINAISDALDGKGRPRIESDVKAWALNDRFTTATKELETIAERSTRAAPPRTSEEEAFFGAAHEWCAACFNADEYPSDPWGKALLEAYRKWKGAK